MFIVFDIVQDSKKNNYAKSYKRNGSGLPL